MDAMTAARFNAYWFLWLLAPAAIMFAFTWRRKRGELAVGVLLSLAATYVLSNLAVARKWELRNQIAVTAAEQAYATGDGANLAFTLLIFGPLEAIALTALWGALGWWLGPKLLRSLRRRA